MMRMHCLLALALALGALGCGSNDEGEGEEPKDALTGKWMVSIDPSCSVGLTFNQDDVYEGDVICLLDDGSYGVEAEVGNYGTDGKVIDFVPTHASCRQANRDYTPYTLSYTVTPTTLRVVTTTGGLVMQKLTDDPNAIGGTAVIHFGCANQEGFVDSEVAPL